MGHAGPAALAPIPGDPDTVLATAARLRAQAATVGSCAHLLRGLTTAGDGSWQGPAGGAFVARARAVVAPLLRIETRYAVAAATLAPLADELRACQAAVAGALTERDDAFPRFLALGEAMSVAEQSAEPSVRSQATGLRAAMVVQGNRVRVAEGEHASAHERWRATDQRAAGVLGRLLQDGLADDGLYDALTSVSDVASGVAETAGVLELVPPVRTAAAPVALAAAGVQVWSDATVRVAYGDGDWATIALHGRRRRRWPGRHWPEGHRHGRSGAARGGHLGGAGGGPAHPGVGLEPVDGAGRGQPATGLGAATCTRVWPAVGPTPSGPVPRASRRRGAPRSSAGPSCQVVREPGWAGLAGTAATGRRPTQPPSPATSGSTTGPGPPRPDP